MLFPTRRSRLPLIGAGFLALVAVASFLILDLGGGSLTASGLPVVQIGQSSDKSGSGQPTTTTRAFPGPGQGAPGAATTASGPTDATGT